MQQPSAKQRLADLLLGRPVLEVITEQRDNGRSWRQVGAHLRDLTDGEIDVTEITLRSWVTRAALTAPGAESVA